MGILANVLAGNTQIVSQLAAKASLPGCRTYSVHNPK